MLLQFTLKDLLKQKDLYIKTLTDSSLEFGEPINDISEVICSRFLEYIENHKLEGAQELTKKFIEEKGIENFSFYHDDKKYRLLPIEQNIGGYEGFYLQVSLGKINTVYTNFCVLNTIDEFLSIYKIITKQHI